jgi:hypothetical protein
LYRSRRSNVVTSQAGTPSPETPNVFSLDFSRPNSLEDSASSDKMSFIEQGGKGIVPGTDAPTSAINGGERVSFIPHSKNCPFRYLTRCSHFSACAYAAFLPSSISLSIPKLRL